MLSAQIAHVQLLGLESLTERVGQWTGERLSGDILVWARHVELTWATLTVDEQQKTLAHARHLLDSAREAQRLLLVDPWMMQELETALAPPHCHASIVANVVASCHAPPELRAAAIRHYCEHSDTPSVGALVSDRLRDARQCAGLAALADVLANALAITTSTGSGTVDVDAAMAQHHIHALGPPIVEAVAGSPHSAQLVRKLLAAPAMRDGVLTAAVLSPGVRAVAEPELVTMLESDVEPLLALDLDGHTAAALCSHSPAVSRAYTECLARATSHCQQRSLRVAAGDWELQLAQIAERWQLLAAKQPDVVAAALAPCRALLAPTVARCRPPATSHLFDATVGFWRALYAQFLDCPAADPSRTL